MTVLIRGRSIPPPYPHSLRAAGPAERDEPDVDSGEVWPGKKRVDHDLRPVGAPARSAGDDALALELRVAGDVEIRDLLLPRAFGIHEHELAAQATRGRRTGAR